MNILYQETTIIEICPTIITGIIIIAFTVMLPFLIVFVDEYLYNKPIIAVSLVIGIIAGCIVGCGFSCVITPPETHYWVDSDTISKEDLDKYELIEQKGKIYILRDIEQAQ